MKTKHKREKEHRNLEVVRKCKRNDTPLPTRYKTIPDVNLQTVPIINLQGLWLEDAGFWCGDRVRVEVSHECIVIRPEKRVWKSVS